MDSLIHRLQALLRADQCLVGLDIEPRYLGDTMEKLSGALPLAVVRPESVAQVSAILRSCNDAGVGVVPQGGATGLAGGATPAGDCIVLSLERMRGVEEIDPAARTLTAWAGTPLQAVQEAAWDAGFFYPVDIGGRGSCQIGGNVATNAGGNRVIRYGMTRDQVLGLEVVLADGTVLTSLNKMMKNNAGYDLKQHFIGSEGTLGVITRVVLRLQPQPRSTCTALCAVSGYEDVLRLLQALQGSLGNALSAFEVMWPDFYELITTRVPGRPAPLAQGHGAYVLIEASGSDAARDQALFQAALEGVLEQGIVEDAVIAQSQAEARRLWAIRDGSGEFRSVFWPHVGFDVSLPAGDIGRFVAACTDAVRRRWPEAKTVFFGHVGDSNIHIGVKAGEGDQPTDDIDAIVYGLVRDWAGSVSAEHGIGLLKRHYLRYSRSEEEIALMKRIKRTLDPRNILNPAKIFEMQ
ncbi:FAD/FMN-containing dehydrogenase [Noviherbaspirillum humi]|uniref:FAD/FMN-containing dehydrogenase n=1 Tax=Noviherbaspirillum humi TaxID=1688639 RepID=A0A239LNK2_9BURK|nr:FAD-binding oxidoreductase [Noviherbaspirillum humi]SNT31468.1 FAD/FMN-containing dehydrogenase [Noviherbaspirillum humi]